MNKVIAKKLENKTKEELLDILCGLTSVKGVTSFIILNYLMKPESKIKELERIFRKYNKSTNKFYDYFDTIKFFKNLTNEVLKPIEQNLTHETSEFSARLIDFMIDSFEGLIANKDDSNGCSTDFLDKCFELCGKTWQLVPNRDIHQLTNLVKKYYKENDYTDKIIFNYFKGALGKEGLLILEEHFANDKNVKLYLISLQNNPDKYIAAFSDNNLINSKHRINIAKLLIDDFRPEEAVVWLEQISVYIADHDIYKARQDLLIQAFSDNGQGQEAQEVRWRAFTDTLEPKYYNAYIKNANPNELEGNRKLAIELASKQKDFNATLSFLESIQEYDIINKLIIENLDKLDEYNYSYYRKLSKALAANSKYLSAVLIRRSLVDDLLAKGASKYYDYAVSDLKLSLEFGKQVEDWQGQISNEKYLTTLMLVHKKKYSFLDKVKLYIKL